MRPVANGSRTPDRPHRVAISLRLRPRDFDTIKAFAVANGVSVTEAIGLLARQVGKARSEKAAA